MVTIYLDPHKSNMIKQKGFKFYRVLHQEAGKSKNIGQNALPTLDCGLCSRRYFHNSHPISHPLSHLSELSVQKPGFKIWNEVDAGQQNKV